MLKVSDLVKKYDRPDPETKKDKEVEMDEDRPSEASFIENDEEDEEEEKKKKKEGTKAVKGISFGV